MGSFFVGFVTLNKTCNRNNDHQKSHSQREKVPRDHVIRVFICSHEKHIPVIKEAMKFFDNHLFKMAQFGP